MPLFCQMLSLAKLHSLVVANMCRIDDCVLKHWVHRREGSLLWHWPGVNASERTVHAIWLGESTVAALTNAGKIYTLPKQTGAPVADFMKRLTVRYFTHTCSSLGSSAHGVCSCCILLLACHLSSLCIRTSSYIMLCRMNSMKACV